MSRAVRAFLTALLWAVPGASAAEPLLEIVSRRVMPPAQFRPFVAPGARTVPVAIVLQEGSPWDRAGALEGDLGKASGILARCATTLGEAEILSIRWSPAAAAILRDENPSRGPAVRALMGEPALPSARPLIFLFPAGYMPAKALAFNRASADYQESHYPGSAALAGTIWMTADFRFGPRPPSQRDSFSMLAHELAHILGNLGHSEDVPNLMKISTDLGAQSGDLNDDQCAAIASWSGS